MKCAWQELLSILPQQIRQDVDTLGRDSLQELRLRLNRPPELVIQGGFQLLNGKTSQADLNYTVNAASKYSPWAAATVRSGYITAMGGHRIGLCGECVIQDGVMTGIRNVTSLCIRVARDITGIAPVIRKEQGSLLILGPPGSGKTTLLRDVLRQISKTETVAVVDERGEIFPPGCSFEMGRRCDVMTACSKQQGIPAALRTMGPNWIAVDEITDQRDCQAMLRAAWCGVKLIATAHASDTRDLFCRPVYEPILKSSIFDTLLILQPDKSCRMERMKL